MSDIRKYIRIIETNENEVDYEVDDDGSYVMINSLLNGDKVGEIAFYYDSDGFFSDDFIHEYNSKHGNKLGSELYIDGVTVHKDYRGMGIGAKLIQQAIEFALAKRIDVVTLRADGSELSINYLIDYYLNLGFVNDKDNQYGGDESTFYKIL